jgi:hypothetical protein
MRDEFQRLQIGTAHTLSQHSYTRTQTHAELYTRRSARLTGIRLCCYNLFAGYGGR